MNLKLSSYFVAVVILSLPTLAKSEVLDLGIGFHQVYQQFEFNPQDVQADFSLAKVAYDTPKRLYWKVTKNEEASKQYWETISKDIAYYKPMFHWELDDINNFEEDSEESNVTEIYSIMENLDEYLQNLEATEYAKEKIKVYYKNKSRHFEGHINPIKKDELLNMFLQVIVEEKKNNQITPKVGTKLNWSKEFRKKHIGKFPLLRFLPKIFVALTRGQASQYMISGKEIELAKALVELPYNSLTLDQLFRISYQINDGDVYMTLLTIENVFSRDWGHSKREKKAVARRLKPIINTYLSRGDKFGSWYHLFGIMIYGYSQNSFTATMIGMIESMGSHILGDQFGDETQEDFVNKQGGSIGAKLRRAIKKEKYLKFKPNSEYLNENYYLNLNEDFYDRIEFAQYPDIKAAIKGRTLHIKALDYDLKGCTITVYPRSGYFRRKSHGPFDGEDKKVYNKINLEAGKEIKLGRIPRTSENARVLLSNCTTDSTYRHSTDFFPEFLEAYTAQKISLFKKVKL